MCDRCIEQRKEIEELKKLLDEYDKGEEIER